MAEPGSWFAGEGRAAVNLFERMICGRGAVFDPATAEGMAMVSRRSAVLLPEEQGIAFSRPVSGLAVVYHEIAPPAESRVDGATVRLVASTIQEAIDHCLVAHWLVRKRRIPVVCALPAQVADRMHFVALPSREIIDALLESENVESASGGMPASSLEDDLQAAFDAVGNATGRSLAMTAADDLVEEEDDRAAGKCLSIAAWPRRHFALPLMLDVCARLREHRSLMLDRHADRDGGVEALVLRETKCRLAQAKDIDVLLVSEPAYCDFESIGEQLRDGAVVILITMAAADGDALDDAGAAALASKKARIVRIDPSAAPSFGSADEFAVLQGALLAGIAAAAPWLEEACSRAGDADASGAWGYAALKAGLRGDVLEAEIEADERSPSAWAEQGVLFHRTGRGKRWRGEPLASAPLWPKALAPLSRADSLWSGFPLWIRREDGAEVEVLPCADKLDEAFDHLEKSGKNIALLREHRPRLLREIYMVTVGRSALPFEKVLDDAAEGFLSRFEMSTAARNELESQLREVLDVMRSHDDVIGLSRHCVVDLHAVVVGHERDECRRKLRKNVARLASQLREMLDLDTSHSPKGRAASSLSPTLGGVTGVFLDAEALSAVLPEHRGSQHLGKERRARMSDALEALEAYLSRDPTDDAPRVIYREGVFKAEEIPHTAYRFEHAQPASAALGVFEGLAAEMEALFRATRVARLEIEGDYDSVRHDDAIASLTWSSFSEEEVRAIPQVIVLETVAGFGGPALASFSDLLRSGRPIQVLVVEELLEDLGSASAELMSRYHAGLAYLAVAHREAFVARTTPAHPKQLCESLHRAGKTLRPALVLTSIPSRDAVIDSALELAAAFHARAAPVYTYDPDAGESWADCFDLSDNPDPDRVWPRIAIGRDVAEDTEATVTLADVMAMDLRYRSHFRVLPPDAWSDEQIEIATFIESWAESSDHRVPFIWIEDSEGRKQRAIVTREVALFCRDRARAWRVLQEVAGTDSEYVRRAVREARRTAEDETREALDAAKARHEDEIEELRMRAASEAVDRLVGVLTGSGAPVPLGDLGSWDAAPPPTSPKALDTPKPAESEAEDDTPAQAAEAAVDDEIAGFDDPYIDSALCTTCNECTNLNGMLFKYNDNKQAEIADPAAGTFEQLVMAAEKCPVRCIHPGVPRAGDETATDEMIARAAPFN